MMPPNPSKLKPDGWRIPFYPARLDNDAMTVLCQFIARERHEAPMLFDWIVGVINAEAHRRMDPEGFHVEPERPILDMSTWPTREIANALWVADAVARTDGANECVREFFFACLALVSKWAARRLMTWLEV